MGKLSSIKDLKVGDKIVVRSDLDESMYVVVPEMVEQAGETLTVSFIGSTYVETEESIDAYESYFYWRYYNHCIDWQLTSLANAKEIYYTYSKIGDRTIVSASDENGRYIAHAIVKKYKNDVNDFEVAKRYAMAKLWKRDLSEVEREVKMKQEESQPFELHSGDKVVFKKDLVVNELYGRLHFWINLKDILEKNNYILTFTRKNEMGNYKFYETDYVFSREMIDWRATHEGRIVDAFANCPEENAVKLDSFLISQFNAEEKETILRFLDYAKSLLA